MAGCGRKSQAMVGDGRGYCAPSFGPHLGEVLRAFLVRETELCGAAFWRKNLFYSIIFYSILFYSILFYSILFYYILFYFILFYSEHLLVAEISAHLAHELLPLLRVHPVSWRRRDS